MPQDAFTLRAGAEELNALLSGGKINRIVQPDKDGVLFYIYTGKSLLKLYFCTNASFCRVGLTDEDLPPLPVPPNFCMLLRKYLLGAEILSVETVGFERIVRLRLRCNGDFSCAERLLYAEIMGKYSNVILTEKGVILGALKTTPLEESTRRVTFPGVKYVLPPPQNKADPLDDTALFAALSGYDFAADKAKYLFENVAGLSFDTAARIENAHEKAGGEIFPFLKKYLFSEPSTPCVLFRDGKPYDFSCRKEADAKIVPSLQDAQKEVYACKESERAFDAEKRKLASVLHALKKKQEKLLSCTAERLKECENVETIRRYGEFVTANIYRLQRGMPSFTAENYYEEGCPETVVPLDKTLTPAQNAQKYFRRYDKLKRTKAALSPRYEKEKEDLAYTDSILCSLALAQTKDDLIGIREELLSLGLIKEQSGRKKQEREVPFRTFEKDGFTIYAGRNNVQNDQLLRLAAPDDLWLHTQKYHSSHVVVLTQGKRVSEEVLLFAAAICARYSDGREGSKIPVDYCERRKVKKPARAKAGFVVYTDFQTVLVDPLRD